MTETSRKLIKNRKAKVMLVDENFANEIENLSKKMNTSTKDVIVSAIELLKLSLSREVIIRKPDSNIELSLPFFKSAKEAIKLKGEN